MSKRLERMEGVLQSRDRQQTIDLSLILLAIYTLIEEIQSLERRVNVIALDSKERS